MVVANGPDVESLDPQIATSTAAVRLFAAIFEGLTRLDPRDCSLLPGLAASWQKMDAEGRSWSFRLRPHLRWSDGSPLSVEDVRASWLRLANPQTGATYAAWMQGASIQVHAQSDTIDITFPQPMPMFDRMCAFPALAPIPSSLRQAPPGTAPNPLPCSGPYQLQERRLRHRIRVRKNPFSYRHNEVLCSTIDFLSVEAQYTALNLFLSGEVQYVPNVPDLAVPAIRQQLPESFTPNPQFATYFIRFQIKDSPFQDRDLRLAFSQAIHRQELAASVGGLRPAANTLVPPLLDSYPPATAPAWDLAAAQEALQRYRQHHPGPLPYLEYLYPSSDFHRALAEALQQQWAKYLGVPVAIVNQEAKSFFPAQRALDYQMSHSSWVGDYLDPSTFLDIFQAQSGNNRTGFADEHYDELLQWAAASGDSVMRMELLSVAETYLLEQSILCPLLYDVDQSLIAPNIQGFHRNAQGYVDWAQLNPGVQAP